MCTMGESIGKFTVMGTLGHGAHSTILQIRREKDARIYALKVVAIDDAEEMKFYEQAKHEYEVAQKLDHPNLVKIPAIEIERSWLFQVKKVRLLIEYVDGRTLDRCPAMSVSKLLSIFSQTAAGVAHMHRRGVLHADLKPNNLIVSKTGQVKVIDYGLAWIKGTPKERIQGTPEYMAPETVENGTISELSDIYNFGVTLYRATTLTLPPAYISVDGSPVADRRSWKKLLKPVDSLNPRVPKPLCDLIHQCLAYHPADRPQSMSAILESLEAIRSELSDSEAS